MDLPHSDEFVCGTRSWPHAPPHRLEESGVYFVTARARDGFEIFREEAMRDWFVRQLFLVFEERGWPLEAWVVLSNHYHLVAHSPEDDPEKERAGSLSGMIRKLHSLATKERNRRDGTPGRARLWQNFRETHLTFQESYLGRLNYVHQNAVHHGLVRNAEDWKWCSVRAFKCEVTPAWGTTVERFKFDKIAAADGE